MSDRWPFRSTGRSLMTPKALTRLDACTTHSLFCVALNYDSHIFTTIRRKSLLAANNNNNNRFYIASNVRFRLLIFMSRCDTNILLYLYLFTITVRSQFMTEKAPFSIWFMQKRAMFSRMAKIVDSRKFIIKSMWIEWVQSTRASFTLLLLLNNENELKSTLATMNSMRWMTFNCVVSYQSKYFRLKIRIERSAGWPRMQF